MKNGFIFSSVSVVLLWTTVVLPAPSQRGGLAPAFEAWQPQETWRVQGLRVAPWAPRGATVAGPAAGSREIRFDGRRVDGPGPLACSDAESEFLVTPAEGLFEGNLPAPAGRIARALGFSALPVLTRRVICSTGSFDYHLTASDKASLGLDNEVWTLSRTSQPSSPEAAALELLRGHMTQDMAFTKASVARKRSLLTEGLSRAIANYFARPFPKDEPPPINGDPFTDSQEYPSGFVLGKASVNGLRATAPVQFRNGERRYVIRFELQLVNKIWRVDDLRYDEGSTFRGLLDSGK